MYIMIPNKEKNHVRSRLTVTVAATHATTLLDYDLVGIASRARPRLLEEQQQAELEQRQQQECQSVQ